MKRALLRSLLRAGCSRKAPHRASSSCSRCSRGSRGGCATAMAIGDSLASPALGRGAAPMYCPPLVRDRPRPLQIILGGVVPLAFGALVGVVLGISAPAYWG